MSDEILKILWNEDQEAKSYEEEEEECNTPLFSGVR